MIAQLSGLLAYKSPQYLIVDVGGVGYRVLVSLNSFSSLPETGKTITIHTHTHIREDQLSLFGFTSVDEKNVFQKIISVSGIGPKMALTILSGTPLSELIESITSENIKKLQSIPGVGKKTAERIIIELKDKLQKEKTNTVSKMFNNPDCKFHEDVISALTNLGYQKSTIEKTIDKIEWQKIDTIEKAIKMTLKEMANR